MSSAAQLSAAAEAETPFDAVFLDGSCVVDDQAATIAALERAQEGAASPIVLLTTGPGRGKLRTIVRRLDRARDSLPRDWSGNR